MKDTVLIADSNKLTRDTLKAILENEYNVIETENCKQVMHVIKEEYKNIRALMFDLPECICGNMDIFDELKKLGIFDSVPVFAICGLDERPLLNKYFEAGINDFLLKPFDGDIVLKRLRNFMSLYNNKRESEVLIREQTEDLKEKNRLLSETNDKIIELLGNVVEARNLESGKHIRRVKNFTRILANDIKEHYPKYGLTDKLVNDIVSASAMHDIGKILIPDSILLKPARLTEVEYEEMKTHTVKGSELLEGAREIWGEEYANICKDIALYHHERYDGNGYPYGLAGDEIPISAQIVAVADVYDALVTKRVYKEPVSPKVAYDMITNGQCGKFSDIMIECFKRQSDNLEKLLG
ncbi:MAG TPA: two-component system response regulator [Clostridiales bacterium]|nr:two-component system response regulator [Clostridiales bacterium]